MLWVILRRDPWKGKGDVSMRPVQEVMSREYRGCGLGQGSMKKAELFVSMLSCARLVLLHHIPDAP